MADGDDNAGTDAGATGAGGTGPDAQGAAGGAAQGAGATDAGSGDGDQGDGQDPKALAAELAKVRREAAAARVRLKELEPKAKAHDDAVAASKSELEKAQEANAVLQQKIAAFEVREIRTAAALKAGLDPEMAQFITAGDATGAEEQAKLLAARVGQAAPPAGDFRQGTRQQAPGKRDGNALLREMAGHRG